jgi:hypothetical protein
MLRNLYRQFVYIISEGFKSILQINGAAMNNTTSRYWKIWQVNPAQDRLEYKQIPVTIAQEFAKNQVPDVENVNNNNTKNILLSYFYANQINFK